MFDLPTTARVSVETDGEAILVHCNDCGETHKLETPAGGFPAAGLLIGMLLGHADCGADDDDDEEADDK